MAKPNSLEALIAFGIGTLLLEHDHWVGWLLLFFGAAWSLLSIIEHISGVDQ